MWRSHPKAAEDYVSVFRGYRKMAQEVDSLLRELIFLPDGAQNSWRKRSELRQTLRKAVEGGGERDRHRRCRDVIVMVTFYHKICRESEPSRCLPPGHTVLQSVAYLSYVCSLQDSDAVAALLTEVYHCEKTFERLFAGAIFGVGASYLVTGWKSEFSDVADNFAAVEYFLRHATKSRLTFDGCRLGDVILKEAYLSPLEACLQVGNVEMAFLLIKFGVRVDSCRHSSPARLLLLCKEKIRRVLHQNWELPYGIRKLPLPQVLIRYVESVGSELIYGRQSVK